ncbi:nephrocan-like isoform X2 [Sipha flava]|nr:nephrocan-like isoform X2 [Sipha flava]XP_025408692.1 nephrocan-like isoform X2 [Sipha flava]
MLCSGANLTDVLQYGIDFPMILYLDFSNMTLNTIPIEITKIIKCKKLDLSNNNIHELHTFSELNVWHLEELILSNNSINDLSTLNHDLLFNSKEIKLLNLSSNPITHLGYEEHTLLSSNSLEVLDVSNCQITSLIGPLVLSGLKKLEYLNLSNNPLKFFDGVFSYSLKILNIRNCLINYLGERALSDLKNLEIFDASLNEQLFLKSEIQARSLKTIDVSRCSLRTPNLLGMSELRSAFLNENRIRKLVAYQFINNTKLVHLDLSKNSVEILDPLAFYGMTSLAHLDLSTNMIADVAWETITRTLPSLDTLKMSHNFINSVGPMTSRTLRRLDLHHCWITYVSNDAFARLDRLTELVLADNPLQSLQPGGLSSTNLSALDLSYCRLSHLTAREFLNLPNLTELSLTGNRLVTLRNGTFAKCPKLRLVYMDDNPWRCDCYSVNFAYMAHLVNKTNKNAMTIERMPQCLTPDNVTGMPWQVACRNTLTYGRDNRKNFSMAIGVILILCVSGLTAIFMAVHENIKTRRAMRRRRHLDEYGNPTRGGGLGTGADEYFDEYAAAAESARKLSQLPSYDEAIMLPKPPQQLSGQGRFKRHSCTQTEDAAAMVAAAAAEAVVAAAEAHNRLRQAMSGGRDRGHATAAVGRGGGGSDDWFLSPPPPPPPLPPPGLRVTHL